MTQSDLSGDHSVSVGVSHTGISGYWSVAAYQWRVWLSLGIQTSPNTKRFCNAEGVLTSPPGQRLVILFLGGRRNWFFLNFKTGDDFLNHVNERWKSSASCVCFPPLVYSSLPTAGSILQAEDMLLYSSLFSFFSIHEQLVDTWMNKSAGWEKLVCLF